LAFGKNKNFLFYTSFILDSKANIHICNDVNQAIKAIWPAGISKYLAAGSG